MMNSFIKHFQFTDPWWLLLLLSIIPLLFLRGKLGSRSAITFSSTSILGTLGTKPRNLLGKISFCALLCTITFAAISLARPQWKTQYTDKKASGIDIMLAIDISLSMKAEEEVYHNHTRMHAAKETMVHFINDRPNDRIGIVSFAGRPYPEAATTLDHQFLLEKLNTIEPHARLDQGTAIGSAISAAATRLSKHKDTKSRIIILITDGSNNSGSIAPTEAAKAAAILGIKIHTVAIGTKEGRVPSSIQTYPNQEFDTETLKKIATITKGQYYRAKSSDDLQLALDSIDQLEKTDRKIKVYSHRREYHFWFTAAALSFALCNIFLTVITSPPAPE